jgi:chorismate dehydratase
MKDEIVEIKNNKVQKIKVGAVSYLNTKPLIYGFSSGLMKNEVDITFDYPANIATALLNNTIDIGLIPVAALAKLNNYYIVGHYGIACNGPVASVCLFSNMPIHQIDTILLDYQSNTSVQLLKILLKEYWKLQPTFVDASTNYIANIKGTTAGLIIGDRAFEQKSNFKYVYDLGQIWQLHTGLPFVFAAWVSKQQFSNEFIKQFDAANQLGLNNLQAVILQNPYSNYSLSTYYTQNIIYKINAEMLQVIDLFLKKLKAN